MTQQIINNTPAGSGNGDSAFVAFGKVNSNFSALFSTQNAASNIIALGADPTGAADSTAAIQAALNSGATSVLIPPGNFLFTSLIMPTTSKFVLYGVGPSSNLIQTGSGISWPVNNSLLFANQTLHDLGFTATNGTGHTINTTYTGGNTLRDLYFTDVPNGFFNILVDGSSTTYTHDMRLLGIQNYFLGGNGGLGGIGYGAHAADSSIVNWIMNASNGTQGSQTCLFMFDGAQSLAVSDSHPYNALTHVVSNAGTGVTAALGLSFVNVTLDTAFAGDVVSLNNVNCAIFNGCWIEGVQSGHSGVTLNNCNATVFTSNRVTGVSGAQYIINETGTTDYTSIVSGNSPGIGNFNNPPFNLIGAHSVAKNFLVYNPFGEQVPFTGATTATVAANSTTFLGCNGAQSNFNNTGFMIAPISGMSVLRADIAFAAAPGAGQSFTFSLIANGSTVLTAAAGSSNPVVISGTGVFSASIIIQAGSSAFLPQLNNIAIQLVTSSGAAATNFRYAITCIG